MLNNAVEAYFTRLNTSSPVAAGSMAYRNAQPNILLPGDMPRNEHRWGFHVLQ